MLKKISRNFSIDLIPKVIFSKSKSVDLLLKSGTSIYIEFHNISNNFINLDGDFLKIPFSKSEVFMNKHLSLKDKRNLVKILNLCLHFNDHFSQEEVVKDVNSLHVYDQETHVTEEEEKEYKEYKDKPIAEYLTYKGVDTRLSYILLYALGNLNEG